MRAGSLFSGIGGFDEAFRRAGVETVWQVEIDKACRAVLARHFPHAQRFDDVRTVGRHNLAPVDIIYGGFPCQDLSVAGKRAGLAGARSGLWHEFRRIVDELRPQWVLIENVPGLLSSNGGRDFAVILQGLEELGYGVAWRVLDSQYDGVAQQRRRVFIVGSLGTDRAAEILFEREGVCGDTAPSREARPSVAAATVVSTLQGGGKRGYRVDAEAAGGGNWSLPSVAALTSAQGGPDDNDAQGGRLVVQCVTGDVTHALTTSATGGSVTEDGTGRGTPIVSRCLTEGGRMDGDTETFVIGFHPTQDPISTADLALPVGREAGAMATDLGVRRLTPTECERLQAFPDGWTEGQSDAARYRQLGNAVCVSVVFWIAQRIAATFE